VDKDEDLDVAAARELLEETHVQNVPLTQFGAFGKPGRDPRGHTVTVAYYGVLPSVDAGTVQADDDAASAKWLPLSEVPSSSFAFDHAAVVAAGLKRIVAVSRKAVSQVYRS
jgi:8-oxo-dGTP diphosphatase